MKQEVTIGIFIVIGAAVIIGIHGWLHKLVKFKMDESSILIFFNNSASDFECISTNSISSATDIAADRVAIVCNKSKAIKRDVKHQGSWRLK